MQVNLDLGRELAIGLQRKIVRLVSQMLEQRLAVQLHHVAHFRREHIVSALSGSLTDQFGALFETRLGQQARAHLYHGSGKGAVGTHESAFSPASNASSLPARSSAYNSLQPPTWVWPMKICGKGEPAPARRSSCGARSGRSAVV